MFGRFNVRGFGHGPDHNARDNQGDDNHLPSHPARTRYDRWRLARHALHGWLRNNPNPPQAILNKILAKCQRDPVFWVCMFCTTYDPRKRIPALPFVLFDFQRDLLIQLITAIGNGEDVLIEKSRDVGVSWVVLMAFQWCWLFHPGCHFLLGSRKADLVDRLGDMSTLMQKLRYNLYALPEWMRHEGFKANKHDGVMKLIHPVTGNAIVGESANEHFGRGGRYTAVLLDEFAHWPTAELAFAAAAQSSNCRVIVSTPYGMNNKFARLRFESQIPVVSVHWRQHPERDDAWYAKQRKSMTEDEMARELDICYSMGTQDRVFREFTFEHKRAVQVLDGVTLLRSWDFGYHCPAVLFLQMDAFGRLRVIHEEVGERIQLKDFAEHVLKVTQERFGHLPVEDVADPAGHQHSDKNDKTCIEILNTLDIYPTVRSLTIFDGIELLRLAMSDVIEDLPGLWVDPQCTKLISALEHGYRFRPNSEQIHQEHPHEDLVDCLRYAAIHKLPVNRTRRSQRRKATYPFKPVNSTVNY